MKSTKYSDYIKIQNFLPVYDITDETPAMWRTFIPTRQFCDLLGRSMTAITSSDEKKRRSMWVRGTFGTGKSHASSVVKHILCDPYEDVVDYINNLPNPALRAKVDALRKTKRYFPVVLKGVEGAYNIPRFSLSIQKATKEALKDAGYDLVVDSDFDEAIRWVENHRNRIPELLDANEELKSEAKNCDKLLARLQSNDTDVFCHLEEALASDKTYLTSDSISDWLVEVERKIEEAKIADGLIIFWDEFSSVVDTLQSDRINVLQNIAEKSQKSNVFLYLISHRVESSVSGKMAEEISKMKDRYESVDYKMDEISTYLIMRNTFTIQNELNLNILRWNVKGTLDKKIYDYLCESSSPEEREHIEHLFPLHPYTAFLCSKMANIMGSANRSVLRFMNDDRSGFSKFINDETNYSQHLMLTADWLWDFFLDEFEKEPLCATFTNVFHSHEAKASKMSDDHLRVFKVILLLNALGTKFKETPEKYTPNDKNITYIFSGDRCADKMTEILDWLDTSKIISRDIFGEFKISVASFNPAELEREKRNVEGQYRTSVDFLNYHDTCKTDIQKLFLVGERLMRKCDPQFMACEESESLLRSRLKKYTAEKPNHLHVAIFFAISDESRDMMENRIKTFSTEFKDAILIVPNEVLTPTSRRDFVNFLAQAKVSRQHFNNDDASAAEKAAKEHISKWKNRMMGGTYFLYFNGERISEGIFNNIYNCINKRLSVKIFPSGMESVKPLLKESMTFFANKNFKALVLQVLQKQTRSDMLKFTGAAQPARHIFIDGENNLVNDVCELTEYAINGSSWLVTICKEVDKLIEKAKQKYVDRFSLSEVFAPLMRPPYGFFPSQANWAALAYAFRKHKDDLFNPSTSQPVGDEKLTDMLVDLMKMWDGGTSEPSNKLLLRFGSQEERQLTNLLGEVFSLSTVAGVSMNDLKSLNYARWGITEFCKQKAKYPLWSLLYCKNISVTNTKIINDMISLFNADSYPIPKIKELLHEMKQGGQVDLYKLLTKSANYYEGFRAFIEDIDNVDIQDSWWEELEEELSHLQSEIAFRREEDVKSAVLNFYIRKIKTPEVSVTTVNEDEEEPAKRASVVTVPKVDDTTVKNARSLVKEANMPNMLWQKVVLDLLEDHPEVSEFFVNYLG